MLRDTVQFVILVPECIKRVSAVMDNLLHLYNFPEEGL